VLSIEHTHKGHVTDEDSYRSNRVTSGLHGCCFEIGPWRWNVADGLDRRRADREGRRVTWQGEKNERILACKFAEEIFRLTSRSVNWIEQGGN
jgi:hypothetical protein